VIPPAIFFYYSTLFDSRFKTLQQNPEEEEFYTTLLQIKSDLDAEAFEASRDMLNEVSRHKRVEWEQFF
ncbi:hypothetical protein M2M41_14900, partial [Enterococcus faecalis]|uniref:hypothetical protein n=1 Tax=Enterococcus faecalis TaxID=1351 RepID=UPI002542D741